LAVPAERLVVTLAFVAAARRFSVVVVVAAVRSSLYQARESQSVEILLPMAEMESGAEVVAQYELSLRPWTVRGMCMLQEAKETGYQDMRPAQGVETWVQQMEVSVAPESTRSTATRI
jgi:hypothetical protein